MSRAVSAGARRFVVASASYFVASQLAILAGAGRRLVVTLVLYGFVFHMIFGKGYALIPSYFDRTLAFERAPTLQLALSTPGVLGLAAATEAIPHALLIGSVLWAGGVLVFVGTLGWTVRDNLLGGDTATGGANEDRAPVDRYANLFVPVALLYLLVGSLELLALSADAPTLFVATTAQVSHLFAAGGATLLFLAIGFRLFPRFLVAHPPTPLVAVVLPAGALGPVLVAAGLHSRLLVAGLAVEATAIIGFALSFLVLFARSPRRRVGFYGVLCGMLAGVLGVALAAVLALHGYAGGVVTAHYRTLLVGFLGLSIVGAAYQFYPPSVGDLPGAGDRTAAVSIALLAIGLLCQVGGLVGGVGLLAVAGESGTVLGSGLYAYLLGAAFATRY
jgi:hypothetical protein